MARILVFGGCFDPIASYHLNVLASIMTRAATGQLVKKPGWMPEAMKAKYKPLLPFQEAWILPYNKNPNSDRKLTPIDQRIEMIEKAIKDFDVGDYVQVSDFEEFFNIECGRTKALLKFSKFYSHNDFTFLLGVDEAISLRRWKGSRKLTRELNFLTVGRRNGHKFASRGKKGYYNISDWYQRVYQNGNRHYIGENIEPSNTDGVFIREKLMAGDKERTAILMNDMFITETVADFIRENNLYKQGEQ